MKKKILAVTLATAMTLGTLAGCGNTAKKEDATTTGGSGVNADAVQNLIDATEGTVKLTVWASEEDQDLTQQLIDDFKAKYSDVSFDISLGTQSEAGTKDTVLTDIEAAADVYAFADDQINELVKAGALQEVVSNYTYDVKASNLAGAVEAASVDDKLYAYPMTADNGYFMFYDKSVFSEEDVKSLDKMIEVAEKAGKKIAMDFDSWYLYSFFQGAGYTLTLNDDGSNSCTWNAEGATEVAQSIIDHTKSGVLVNMNDGDQATALAEGTLCACVNGTWRAETAEQAWGENYAATKLPTIKMGSKGDVQMASFSGYKLIGVNAYSKNVGWAMLMAEFLTSEESQIKRFDARGLGPSNINAAASDAVQANPAIAALAAQAEFATPQRVGANYWAPAQTLGFTLAAGNPDGTDLQELLDNAVEGITAPVE